MDFVRQSGLSEREIEQAAERTKYDDPSTVEEQLNWLAAAGFRSIDCIYKKLSFGVLAAVK